MLFKRIFQSHLSFLISRSRQNVFIRKLSKMYATQEFLANPSLLFSKESMQRNPDVIPMVALITGTSAAATAYIIRNALTRDDIRWCPSCKMACEEVDLKKVKRPPIRKMLVINQKYEYPKGLIDALREPTQEELDQMEAERNKKKKGNRKCWLYCFCFSTKTEKSIEQAEAERKELERKKEQERTGKRN